MSVPSGTADPELVRQIVARGGKLLGEFAGVGNTEGVRHLLDLGVDVSALDKDGDGYWGVAKNSMALHVAAWRAQHGTVKLLVERGAPIDVHDGKGLYASGARRPSLRGLVLELQTLT